MLLVVENITVKSTWFTRTREVRYKKRPKSIPFYTVQSKSSSVNNQIIVCIKIKKTHSNTVINLLEMQSFERRNGHAFPFLRERSPQSDANFRLCTLSVRGARDVIPAAEAGRPTVTKSRRNFRIMHARHSARTLLRPTAALPRELLRPHFRNLWSLPAQRAFNRPQHHLMKVRPKRPRREAERPVPRPRIVHAPLPARTVCVRRAAARLARRALTSVAAGAPAEAVSVRAVGAGERCTAVEIVAAGIAGQACARGCAAVACEAFEICRRQ